ncbi:MAG: MBL fold metallo-hydrolase [Verrucomicrobia bacterium]|nr:MBL fold metallo-hydrolase [Verrucomicrobiota bacterium]
MTSDYHGFLGAREQLVAGLERIKNEKPHVLVPSHGPIVDRPEDAIDTLIARLARCYDKYVAISALRHYFPKLFAAYAERKDHMQFAPIKPVPDCLRHVGTSWILVSQDKSAFVMDCGSPKVVKTLQDWLAKGDIRAVEGLWITHYHDDHVDAVPEFQKTFDCPCITDRHVAEVINDPMAWRLPCISPSKARVDRPRRDGESWTWREFKLTAYHFPGQTLYHAGLLVERGDLRMFFAGDSFTAAGIDDYCAWNRCWLGRDVGFDRCVALLERLRPTHIFNCHVANAFEFAPDQYRFMRANLAEREKLFAELLPWDHPNHGLDEAWVRCHPYEQEVAPGSRANFRVVVTNHSEEPHRAECRAAPPRALSGRVTEWASVEIPKKSDGHVALEIAVPAGTPSGRYVIPVDVRYAGKDLPQFKEAILVVK